MVESKSIITKDIIIFSTADWEAPYWTNKQHMAREMTKQGYRVLYIESIGLRAPYLSIGDLRRMWNRFLHGLRPPRLIESNLWVMSPITIPIAQKFSLVRNINQGLLSFSIRSFLNIKSFNSPLVWTYHPFIRETILKIPHGKIVYHCVDDLSAIPGIDSVKFQQEEVKLLAECDVVFVTSLTLKAKCQLLNERTYYLPNVVDFEHFGEARKIGLLPNDIAKIPYPRIGYIGALSDYKVDFELIYEIALMQKGWNWVLIGAEREGQRKKIVANLQLLPNVHFLGQKKYSELPNYLRGIEVGTLPSVINTYTKSMFPMKYFEYLASGIPIVTTPLEFTKSFQKGMIIAENKESFMAAIESQIKRGKYSDDEAKILVGANTWQERLKKMFEILNSSKKN